MGPIHQTCSSNNLAPTEPFLSILIELDPLWKCLSNDISYVQIHPEDPKNEHVNKENGKFHILFPREDMKMREEDTVGIIRIYGIFWDGYNRI